MTTTPKDQRWTALIVLCLGALMIVLDTTIVNVALPSIRTDLGFSESSLAWVVNAYMLVFGGCMLLGGRLGDLFGPRKLFLIGLLIFTGASLLCGLSQSQWLLITSRALQGLGGAIVSAVALSLIMNLFPGDAERAKAMGVYGFVTAGGGSLGVFLGGILTSLNWHYIFLVNIPVGVVVALLTWKYVRADQLATTKQRLDVAGAASVTLGLLLAVYAIVNGNTVGWNSAQTIGMLIASAVVLGLFLLIEQRVKNPLVPLRLLRLRNLAVANVIGILWSAGMFAWFFLSALYLQLGLGYSPFQVGVSFLPANIIMAMFSLGVSAKIVNRFGIKKPLGFGMLLVAIGLALFARAPLDGHFWIDVFPSMALLGIGAGMALNPVLLAAMHDVTEHESGLASGIANTAFMMGGALGLAVLASVASARTAGSTAVTDLVAGYHLAFLVGSIFALCAAGLAMLLRIKQR